MKLRFTRRATENIVEIADYLHTRSPESAVRVRLVIYEALQNLFLFPAAGRLQKIGGVRKLVVAKYSYLIYYTVDDAAEEIIILNVKHPARAREHQDR